jgi:type IV secretion system protein VirB9
MKSVRVFGIGRAVVAFTLHALLVSLADAETLPARGSVDERVRVAQYVPDEIYRLYGYVGYAIELIFEEGETFAGDAGGDLEGLTVGHFANHLILKPKAPNVGSNLVIYTNRRAYRFDYSASARRPDPGADPVMYVVRFLYPEEPKAPPVKARAEAEQVAAALAAAPAEKPHNWDYWYCGAREIAPTAASDDGVQTRLSFGARAELPAVFVLNADGTESLVNTHFESGDLVIQRVARKFVLRRGKLTGCVVNKSFAGGGERLESGTVSPAVSRETRGATP